MDAPATPRRLRQERQRARLRWRCRRGTKELDLLLERFLAGGVEDLDETRLASLEALLMSPDQDLLAWLCAGVLPDNEESATQARWLRARIGLRETAS